MAEFGQEMTPEQAAAAREYLRPERAIGWKDLPLAGRRRPDARDGELPADLRFGDYWKSNGIWTVYIPGGPVGTLPNHHVEEHEDGTITVEPGGGGISNSIPGHKFQDRPELQKALRLIAQGHTYGYIRRGVWTSS